MADEVKVVFNATNPNWHRNRQFNELFLLAQEQHFNHRLRAYGHVFLNEVFDSLGFPRTPQGAICGWLLGRGPGAISFGIEEGDNKDTTFDLTFNIAGVIYEEI